MLDLLDPSRALAAAARIKKRRTVHRIEAEWEKESHVQKGKVKAKPITPEQAAICVEMRKAGFGYKAICMATDLEENQAKEAVRRWRKKV